MRTPRFQAMKAIVWMIMKMMVEGPGSTLAMAVPYGVCMTAVSRCRFTIDIDRPFPLD
jgi:hypothetical protein